MENGMSGQKGCPRILPRSRRAKKCVASFISKESCERSEGTWTRIHVNYQEVLGKNSICGSTQTFKGVPYESHKVRQGTENAQQELVNVDKPDIIFAPSTVVNHNGINMQLKFSS